MISKSTAKYIQSLQQKKVRDELNAFVAEGPKVVKELLEAGIFECDQIFCTEKGQELLGKKLQEQHPEKIEIVKDFELEKLSGLSVANSMLAVFRKRNTNIHPDLTKKITLVLDDIQDPGNLGTIIRNADWFGIENIFCTPATADAYNPKVVQSTMASLGRVNIVYGDIVKMLSENNAIKKYAAVLGGKQLASFGKIAEGFVIIGNESKGISPQVLELATEKITIPKTGHAESLNAAVAAGIILYGLREGSGE